MAEGTGENWTHSLRIREWLRESTWYLSPLYEYDVVMPIKWGYSYLGWVLLLQVTYSRQPITRITRGLLLQWFWILSGWKSVSAFTEPTFLENTCHKRDLLVAIVTVGESTCCECVCVSVHECVCVCMHVAQNHLVKAMNRTLHWLFPEQNFTVKK